MGDIIWGTPSGDISGITGNSTSIPLSSHSESLLDEDVLNKVSKISDGFPTQILVV